MVSFVLGRIVFLLTNKENEKIHDGESKDVYENEDLIREAKI